ncbi:hypothetical protein AKJ41_05840 [candidate division MSBL1 archaeon SCGC-AAA259O05]|uniref:Aminotransferase n=2 Tax=candidate division MSBL1 TaxID=215777 RepID=A0A133UYB4_9EURY|nr:hypothetical protein AKJ64_00010 [candidate division MSBL1 archaeon SCGC-AAA259E17]KXA99180.1 hypothetical protein AKJ41_05840 [candidate division MSBL1 archaeon SCGC-AAA259O05]
MISRRANSIEPSATLRISDMVKEMRNEGREVISLSVGEPDFDTPEEVKDAAIVALKEGKTGYTSTPGIYPLRNAISDKFERDNNIDADEEEIIVTPGGKFSIYLICQSILDEGKKVGIFDPSWVSYLPNVRLAGAEVEWIDTDESFHPDLLDLKDKISDLKMLYLNSPCNPTGAVYPRETIREVVETALDEDVFLLSDEVYENLIFEGAPYSPGSDYSNVITVNSCSKPYAMTGWRVGYFTGPKEVIDAAQKIQSHSVSCATSFAQHGAVRALTSKRVQEKVTEMREEFKERRDLICEGLKEIDGLNFVRPEGAFYCFIKYDLDMSSIEFCENLLKEEGVGVTPGSAFGPDRDRWIRISYANSRENLKKALEKIGSFMEENRIFDFGGCE